MMTILSFGPFLSIIQLFAVILYLAIVLAVVVWMVKMLKNSNESIRLQKEILEELKKKS